MKILKTFFLTICLLVCLNSCSHEQETVQIEPTLNAKWAEITLTAKGMGAPPSNAENQAQARLMACKAAETDAFRDLVQQIHGIQIDSRTYVKDFITRSDEISTKTMGFIRKARVVNQKENPDGSCEVTLELFLGRGFAEIIMR